MIAHGVRDAQDGLRTQHWVSLYQASRSFDEGTGIERFGDIVAATGAHDSNRLINVAISGHEKKWGN